MRVDRILPYRFITAARYAPDFEPELEQAMLKSIEGLARLKGRTRLLIDVSGSMDAPLSRQSEMTRLEAACGLAILAREVCERIEIFTFSNDGEEGPAPARLRAARRDRRQPAARRNLSSARRSREVDKKGERLIVFTDEQCTTRSRRRVGLGYMVNVASYQHGVGNGPWRRVDGFSEAVIAWIAATEGA